MSKKSKKHDPYSPYMEDHMGEVLKIGLELGLTSLKIGAFALTGILII